MSGRGDRSDESLPEELGALTAAQRQVLSVLAVVGSASLSPEALAAVTNLDDVEGTLAELERRGLVRREDERRKLAAGLAPRLRRIWDIADNAERVLRQLVSIAEDGRLTLDDLDAVLAVTDWAAQTGRWSQLLRLVRATETALSLHERVETWIAIVERVQAAARAADHREAEEWADRQLAARRQTVTAAQPVAEPVAARRGVFRSVVAAAAAAGVAAAGFVAGGALADPEPLVGTTATLPPDTVTLPRQTLTLGGRTTTLPRRTVTAPGETVTLPAVTTTVTTTEITTTTTTVFTTPPTPAPG